MKKYISKDYKEDFEEGNICRISMGTKPVAYCYMKNYKIDLQVAFTNKAISCVVSKYDFRALFNKGRESLENCLEEIFIDTTTPLFFGYPIHYDSELYTYEEDRREVNTKYVEYGYYHVAK